MKNQQQISNEGNKKCGRNTLKLDFRAVLRLSQHTSAPIDNNKHTNSTQ